MFINNLFTFHDINKEKRGCEWPIFKIPSSLELNVLFSSNSVTVIIEKVFEKSWGEILILETVLSCLQYG